ncbi:hypothetical protein V2J09_022421 [Rumex salicifolius]
MKREDELTQIAYVTFKDSQGAETAILLTGQNKTETALRKAEDVVSSMLAKGFMLGKDAVNKAKVLDEKHQLSSTASVKIASLDQKMGLSEKISMGTAVVNDKVREVDQKFQVSEKTKSAYAAAEQKVSNAGSAIMKNRYVLTGATWVTGAFTKVSKAAGEVEQKTREKVDMAEGEQKRKVVDDFAQIHLSESDSPKTVVVEKTEAESLKGNVTEPGEHLQAPTKPESEPVKGLVL